MAEFPAMPIYTDALFADCAHLTDAEFGLYLRLLFQMWRSPTADGCLPDDDAWLARRFGKTVEAIQRDLRPLIDEFCFRKGNRISQRRLQRELEHARGYSKRQSDRAKTRWNKEKGAYRGNAGHALHPLAMHPNPISKITTTEQEPASKKRNGQAEGARREAEPIPVSPELAARLTRPKPEAPVETPKAEYPDLPEFLRRDIPTPPRNAA